MFKKLFAKKNDGFFLQAEEAASDAAPATEVAQAPVAVATESTTSAEPTASNAAEPKAKKTSIKEKKAKPATTPAQPSVPVVAAKAAAPASVTTFAPDYLIKPSSNSSRRRPGANMKSFVEMARQTQAKK